MTLPGKDQSGARSHAVLALTQFHGTAEIRHKGGDDGESQALLQRDVKVLRQACTVIQNVYGEPFRLELRTDLEGSRRTLQPVLNGVLAQLRDHQRQ